MKHITFYLDFLSPYAYLAFEKLPEALLGHSYNVSYQPVLLAGVLKHHGQLGPAEIPPKREWTYRQVLWLAQQNGVELKMPALHPFNPLALLRLALACGEAGQANRYVCESVFHHVWRSGADALEPARLQALTEQLAPQRDPAGDTVKQELKTHTQEALERGLFGVPTFEVDGKLFWGFDTLPMLKSYLQGDSWFAGPDWEQAGVRPVGASRKPEGTR